MGSTQCQKETDPMLGIQQTSQVMSDDDVPRPSRSTSFTATTALKSAQDPHVGETDRARLLRTHNGLDIDSPQTYMNGTLPVQRAIHDILRHIDRMESNTTGFPLRAELKKIQQHFTSTDGTLRATSPLWMHYGDTRLLSRPNWLYLVTTEEDDRGHGEESSGDMVSQSL